MPKHVISIDCGGTNLRVAMMDENLKLLAVDRVPSIHDDGERLADRMCELIEKVQEEAGVPIDAIGMSICGIVSHNVVGRCGNLGLEDGYDFVGHFHGRFPKIPVRIANDGNCSAYVESRFGSNKGLSDSAFVTISSGIGLGIVHCGEMIDTPMEGGRLLIEYKGKMYESEYLLSGNGIVRLCAMEGLPIAKASEFFDAVKKRDVLALRIYDIWIRLLGTWFANLQLLFNLEGYAVSGGTWRAHDVYLEDLTKVANASIACWHLNPIALHSAQFEEDVGLAGAAALALHELEK